MILQNLIPFDNYTLKTHFSVEEVQTKMAAVIEPELDFALSFATPKRSKPYEGSIVGNYFKMSRIIDYRNSFLPVIKGKINRHKGQTEVNIDMRPPVYTLIFMSVWLGIVGSFCLGLLITGISRFRQVLQQSFSLAAFIPFGMFLFGIALLLIPYKLESRKSKKFLAELLAAGE